MKYREKKNYQPRGRGCLASLGERAFIWKERVRPWGACGLKRERAQIRKGGEKTPLESKKIAMEGVNCKIEANIREAKGRGRSLLANRGISLVRVTNLSNNTAGGRNDSTRSQEGIGS